MTTENKNSPTGELYQAFTSAYDFFNKELFDGELPPCIVTVQRGKPYFGFFSPNRWKDGNGHRAHEIAMNTAYFQEQTLMEVMQTLVHEMCHLWQHDFGKPSRNGYHNKEWADKMESVGLMPSATFQAGGARTGQKMGDYPLKNGSFENACRKLVASGFFFKWTDRTLLRIPPHILEQQENGSEDVPTDKIDAVLAAPLVNFDPSDVIDETTKTTTKNRYICACGCKVWGKKGLQIICGRCGSNFIHEENGAE